MSVILKSCIFPFLFYLSINNPDLNFAQQKTLKNFYLEFFRAMCSNTFLEMFVYLWMQNENVWIGNLGYNVILCPHVMCSYFICKCIFLKFSKLSRPELNKCFFISVFILRCQIFFFFFENEEHSNTEPWNGGLNRFIDFGDIQKEMTESW